MGRSPSVCGARQFERCDEVGLVMLRRGVEVGQEERMPKQNGYGG